MRDGPVDVVDILLAAFFSFPFGPASLQGTVQRPSCVCTLIFPLVGCRYMGVVDPKARTVGTVCRGMQYGCGAGAWGHALHEDDCKCVCPSCSDAQCRECSFRIRGVDKEEKEKRRRKERRKEKLKHLSYSCPGSKCLSAPSHTLYLYIMHPRARARAYTHADAYMHTCIHA